MTTLRSTSTTARRRRTLGHQCALCRRHWAMRTVAHPAGEVVLCVYCGSVRHAMIVDLPRPRAI